MCVQNVQTHLHRSCKVYKQLTWSLCMFYNKLIPILIITRLSNEPIITFAIKLVWQLFGRSFIHADVPLRNSLPESVVDDITVTGLQSFYPCRCSFKEQSPRICCWWHHCYWTPIVQTPCPWTSPGYYKTSDVIFWSLSWAAVNH